MNCLESNGLANSIEEPSSGDGDDGSTITFSAATNLVSAVSSTVSLSAAVQDSFRVVAVAVVAGAADFNEGMVIIVVVLLATRTPGREWTRSGREVPPDTRWCSCSGPEYELILLPARNGQIQRRRNDDFWLRFRSRKYYSCLRLRRL
jgi:hypothetical protein